MNFKKIEKNPKKESIWWLIISFQYNRTFLLQRARQVKRYNYDSANSPKCWKIIWQFWSRAQLSKGKKSLSSYGVKETGSLFRSLPTLQFNCQKNPSGKIVLFQYRIRKWLGSGGEGWRACNWPVKTSLFKNV